VQTESAPGQEAPPLFILYIYIYIICIHAMYIFICYIRYSLCASTSGYIERGEREMEREHRERVGERGRGRGREGGWAGDRDTEREIRSARPIVPVLIVCASSTVSPAIRVLPTTAITSTPVTPPTLFGVCRRHVTGPPPPTSWTACRACRTLPRCRPPPAAPPAPSSSRPSSRHSGPGGSAGPGEPARPIVRQTRAGCTDGSGGRHGLRPSSRSLSPQCGPVGLDGPSRAGPGSGPAPRRPDAAAVLRIRSGAWHCTSD
jgi:hypothetical protein